MGMGKRARARRQVDILASGLVGEVLLSTSELSSLSILQELTDILIFEVLLKLFELFSESLVLQL